MFNSEFWARYYWYLKVYIILQLLLSLTAIYYITLLPIKYFCTHISTVCLMTAYYVVLCTMFWVLIMLRTYMFCLLICSHRGSERLCPVRMEELTIKLTSVYLTAVSIDRIKTSFSNPEMKPKIFPGLNFHQQGAVKHIELCLSVC